ncbi:MAG: transposase [Phycisphaeraceae bacterium]|nr:transposase [Phycisphaeraceae bacterium]
MILAYHVTLSAYGFWLPNDPRGSWSSQVRSQELRSFGPATKTSDRHSLAGRKHNVLARQSAKAALRRKPVVFTGRQALVVASGLAAGAEAAGCSIYACAILPQHVHLVIGRHRYDIEQLINLLKGAATRQLTAEGLHPFADLPYASGRLPSPWARCCWRKYLRYPAEVRHAITYVQQNPLKDGKRPQRWRFVKTFEDRAPAGQPLNRD